MTLFGDDARIPRACRVVGCNEPAAYLSAWCEQHLAPVVEPALPADAGETQRETQHRRTRDTEASRIREVIESALTDEPGLTDYQLQERVNAAGLDGRHERVSSIRNALMLRGVLTLHADPDGKRHPLKRIDQQTGRPVVVSRGPWQCRQRVDENGKRLAPLLRWYLADGESR